MTEHVFPAGARVATWWWRVAAPLVVAALLLPGCAGYRTGWESLAYLGDVPPPPPPETRSAFEAESRPPMVVPGLAFKAVLDNRLQTGDTQVALAVVPTQLDRRERAAPGASPLQTRVALRVTVLAPGFVFEPRGAVLRVGTERYAATGGGVSTPFVLPASGVYFGLPPVPQDIAGPASLGDIGFTYELSLLFPAPTPGPQRADIALDLSSALRSPAQPPLPLVRFLPIRWRAGYT